MLKMAMFKQIDQFTARPGRLACTAGLLAVLAAGNINAQSGGPRYVEDFHQQAMRAPQSGAMQAGYAAPSPSQQSRFPQPTMQSFGPQQQPQQSEGWGATRGLKKALSGLFGGDSAETNTQPVASHPSMFAPVEAQQAKSSKPLGKRSFGATRNAASREAQVAAKSADSGSKKTFFSMFTGGSDQRETPPSATVASRPTQRAGTAEQLAQRESNQPQGLFGLFAKSYPTGPEKVPAPQPTTKPQAAPRSLATNRLQAVPMAAAPKPAKPTAPAEPKWPEPKWTDDTLVMVTDQQAVASSSKPADKPQGTRIVQTPGAPLPTVTGPAATSELAKPSETEGLATVFTPQKPVEEVAQPESPATEAEPKEIVNQHAVAAATDDAELKPFPSTGRGMMPVKSLAGRVANAPAAMPANPVAPPTSKDIEPSAKAVELLSQANQLSTSADSEDELSEVVQLCRHVLAIDRSAVAVDYSRNLASWALNRRGELRHEQGRTKEALLDFEDSLKLSPERYRAIHNRGVLAAQAGRYADAFDDFNRTIQIEPGFAKAYSNRGTLYVQAGDLQKASDDYLKAISLDPDLAVAHKGRGRVCHLLGQFELALQHLDAATRLSPNDAHIVCQRGDLLMDMGRYRAAMVDYQQTVALDDTLVLGYRNLAWLEATCPDRECRNAQLAIEHAERAMELSDEPGDLEYDTLAAAHAAAGHFDKAVGLMHECLALAADDDKANYQWRRQLYEQGQPYVTEPASDIQQASYAE